MQRRSTETEATAMRQQSVGWGPFGAYSLDGELPREAPLTKIERRIKAHQKKQTRDGVDRSTRIQALQREWRTRAKRIFNSLEPWETVLLARHQRRPLVRDYISGMVDDFVELHGDKVTGDDPAIVAGMGMMGNHRVMIVGHNRGREVSERTACRFGCAGPEGYRKAIAKMKLAAKFGLPIVTLIDTPGAYPGVESEERGIAHAIAQNLVTMPQLSVPIVSVVIGEGGSGGALGIGVADRLAMLEHSIFSVISPEGGAAILWRQSTFAKEAAEALKLRSHDLLAQGIIDQILPEPLGGAHRDVAATIATVESFVLTSLDRLVDLSPHALLEERFTRLREIGRCFTTDDDLQSDVHAPSAD